MHLPLPELTALRTDVATHASAVPLADGCPWRVTGVSGLHLDIELSVSAGSAQRVVVVLHSWRPSGKGTAALVYDWRSRRLDVVFDALHNRAKWMLPGQQLQAAAGSTGSSPFSSWRDDTGRSGDLAEGEEGEDEEGPYEVIRDPDYIPDPDMNPDVEQWIRMRRDEAGGELDLPPGAPLRLRLFLDASCLEVFTSSGQALTTRVYRGHPAPGLGPAPASASASDPGIELLALGGDACLDDLHAYEMGSCWSRPQDVPLDGWLHR